MQEVSIQLQSKADKLSVDEEKLITTFIEENFDNVLAPFAFQMVTGGMEAPMFTPWIEVLMTKATDAFKNNSYVKEFLEIAERNRNIMTGMETPAPTLPEQPLDQAPTPNELAAPEQ